LDLLRAGDRRVDIVSSSDILLAPLQISSIQETPLDDRIVFKTQSGTNESVKSWSFQVIDEKGAVRNFGPFTKKEAYISGNTLLGDRSEGDYKIIMLAQTEEGHTISKESKLHLVRNAPAKEEALRFSILFDFDQSKTVATYEKFLTNVVMPLVPDNATILIHGHSDVIGDDEYNLSLSMDRAQEAKRILEAALAKAGKKGMRYETYGFGSDPALAPFENKFPEENFYNRTVIIDIIPAS
jgi:outer membrane protein OmpA-like peptidoglycan-associated protein